MQPQDPRSFFVRVFPQEPGTSSVTAERRGYVVELPRGRERYFERLDEIVACIAAFIAEDDIDRPGS